MLDAGSVRVVTSSAGAQADDIQVSTTLSWTSTASLSLDAYRSIRIDRPLAVESLGGLSLTTNDGATGGVLLFGKLGHVSFKQKLSSLSINGVSHTLVKSLGALASAVAAKPSGAYALADSYDASQDGVYSNSPVPTVVTGSIEGLGNTISNVSLSASTNAQVYYGLFSELNGAIANLRLTGLIFAVQKDSKGALGGLVGENKGILIDDHVTGMIRGTHSAVGGLVGLNSEGAISFSSSGGTVNGTAAGGLVGLGGLVGATGGTITASFSNASVIGEQNGSVGGLVGAFGGGTIQQSFAAGAVQGAFDASAGGLVGATGSGNLVANCYSRSPVSVSSSGYVGGLIGGSAGNAVENAYAAGSLAGSRSFGIGGVFGANQANTTDLDWDTDTSKTNVGTGSGSANTTGLTTAQLKSGLPPGFDPAIWGISANINKGFPYLLAVPPE